MPEPRIITYRAAILEALFAEMRRDPAVLVMGEDVGAAGGVFKQAAGLFEEFGAERVIDTPISESGAFGIAAGSAMSGSRPVFEVMFGDFITLVMDQLANQAAKVHYMSAGQFTVPLVLRTAVGIGANLGPQHSQSLHAWTAHIPGLKVVMPSTPADAKGLMAAAIRDDNPVVYFEDRTLYTLRGDTPQGDHLVPIGVADVKRAGEDVTIVATSRAVVVDGGYRQYGITGEIAATLAEQAFDWLDAPVMRIGAENVPIPFSRSLEPLVVPDAARLAKAVADLVRRR